MKIHFETIDKLEGIARERLQKELSKETEILRFLPLL